MRSNAPHSIVVGMDESAGAAGVLLEHAVGADLLVVGSRGQGALKRALVGSVAARVSHHAMCPTVVIPAGGDPR